MKYGGAGVLSGKKGRQPFFPVFTIPLPHSHPVLGVMTLSIALRTPPGTLHKTY